MHEDEIVVQVVEFFYTGKPDGLFQELDAHGQIYIRGHCLPFCLRAGTTNLPRRNAAAVATSTRAGTRGRFYSGSGPVASTSSTASSSCSLPATSATR